MKLLLMSCCSVNLCNFPIVVPGSMRYCSRRCWCGPACGDGTLVAWKEAVFSAWAFCPLICSLFFRYFPLKHFFHSSFVCVCVLLFLAVSSPWLGFSFDLKMSTEWSNRHQLEAAENAKWQHDLAAGSNFDTRRLVNGWTSKMSKAVPIRNSQRLKHVLCEKTLDSKMPLLNTADRRHGWLLFMALSVALVGCSGSSDHSFEALWTLC